MGLFDIVCKQITSINEERARNKELQEAIFNLMQSRPHWLEWSVTEIRNKLEKPYSIYEVENALKAIVKSNSRFKLREHKFYVYD